VRENLRALFSCQEELVVWLAMTQLGRSRAADFLGVEVSKAQPQPHLLSQHQVIGIAMIRRRKRGRVLGVSKLPGLKHGL
jgi:hypothetical protein